MQRTRIGTRLNRFGRATPVRRSPWRIGPAGRSRRGPLLLAVAVLLGWALPLAAGAAVGAQSAQAACRFAQTARTWRLQADCTTRRTIEIPNGVTLNGMGHTISLSGPISGFFVPSVGVPVGILAQGGNANVVNLKVEGRRLSGGCGATPDPAAILLWNTSGRIFNVGVANFRLSNGDLACGGGIGAVADDNPNATVTVSRATVTNTGTLGIFLDVPVGLISDSTVRTVTGNPINQGRDAIGIAVFDSTDVTIRGNRVEGVSAGIGVYGGSGTVEDNTVTNALGGIVGADGSVTVRNNTVTGRGAVEIPLASFITGVAFSNGASGLIKGNTISNFFDTDSSEIGCGIRIFQASATIGANAFPNPPGNEQNVCV